MNLEELFQSPIVQYPVRYTGDLAANLSPVVQAFTEDMEKVRIEQAKIADRRAVIDMVVIFAAFLVLFVTISSVTDWAVSTWMHNALVWIGRSLKIRAI